MSSFLEIDKLNVQINDKEILSNVSINIKEVAKIGLIGESGAGKSLFAMCILDSEHEYKASKNYLNFKIDNLSISNMQQDVSYIPQEPLSSLNPTMKVEKHFLINENILIRKDEIKKKIKDLLLEVGLDNSKNILNLYPHQLSGGMAQRILIALAIQNNPKLIIADEATSSLDTLNEKKILQLLNNLVTTRNIGILLVTHNLNIADSFCDFIYEVKNKTIRLVDKNTLYPKKKLEKKNLKPINLNKLIEINSLNFYIGEKHILKNINFEINKDSCVGLIGLSGSGKSTLAKILIKLYKNFHGDIKVFNKNINSYSYFEYSKKVQQVQQDLLGTLNPKRKIYKSLIDLKNLIKIDENKFEYKLKDLLERLNLQKDILNSYPMDISGGQRQRVLILKALLWDPEFLILDEPISSLDLKIQDEIIDIINDLRNQLNLSILAISHDIHFIKSICDSVHVLKEGEILESGPLKKIIDNPYHDYTKNLISQ